MKKLLLIVPIILFSILGLNSCKKNAVEEIYTETVHPVIPDLSTQVSASVAGFVTDENGNPVEAATVKGGAITTTTDAFGYFKITNTNFAKSAGFVLVTKAGYFNGIKTFLPVTANEHFVRLQMIPKSITGNVNSTTGGTITTSNGATVTLPANGFVVATNNAPYSGNVNAAIHWLNPADQPVLQLTMPGDLQGIDSDGYLKMLTTYGMLAVEITGDAGELLQLAPGSKATLNFPIPSSLQSSAPASLPLWYFDEGKGLWKEDGSAIKNGSNYQGEVSHFTFWNCDVPSMSVVNFYAQVVDDNLSPLLNATVTISIAGVPNSGRTGYTNANGEIHGMIPGNSNLVIEIKTGALCNTAAYSQNFTTTTANVNLGTFAVSDGSFSAVLMGSVNNCNGLPVTNGVAIVSAGGISNAIEIQNGVFNASTIVCTNTNGFVVTIDRDLAQQSVVQNVTIVAGTNNFGAFNACGITSEIITYSLDGNPTTLSLPENEFNGNYFSANDSTGITAIDQLSFNTAFDMGFPATTAPGVYTLSGSITLNQLLYILPTPTTITITNYGGIGDFITGSTGTFQVLDMGGNPHTFSCTFNVVRDN